MTDVVIEKKGHVAIVKIEHMKAMNALSTDMYAQLEELSTSWLRIWTTFTLSF